MMDCRVIKDLIPLYIEQLTSEPSNALVSEHIESCSDCRQTLARLKNNLALADPDEASKIDPVPIQLVKRIRKSILRKAIILASIALAVGILIGIISSSPVMFMAFMGATAIIAFTASIFLSIAVCRKTSSMRKKFRRVANWTFLFSMIVSCLIYVLFLGYYNEFLKMAIVMSVVILLNIIFSSTMRIYARTKLPEKDVAGVPASNRRLYFVAFCTLLVLTFLIAVPVAVLEKNRIVDNIDLPFENDPDLIGKWKTVDFVRSPEQFVPGKRASKNSLFLENMTFLPGGRIRMVMNNPEGRRYPDLPRPWLSWTKGVMLHKGGDHTASKYILREINGTKYLFLEQKTGEEIYFHQPPKYHVLEKLN